MFNLSASWSNPQQNPSVQGDQNVLNLLLQGQKQILENQSIIFNKVFALEQRFENLERKFTKSCEHLTEEKVEVSKAWFEKSFQIQGFKTKLTQELSGESFKIPVIVKSQTGTVEVQLKWIRSDTTLSAEKVKVIDIMTHHMKLYLKKYREASFNFYSAIPKTAVALEFAQNGESVSVCINTHDFPLCRAFKSFVNLGVAENQNAEPAFLLQDIVHISKFPSLHGDSKLNAMLSSLLKSKQSYVNAFWYDSLLRLCDLKGLKAEANKRPRLIEDESGEEVPAKKKRNTQAQKEENIPIEEMLPAYYLQGQPSGFVQDAVTAQMNIPFTQNNIPEVNFITAVPQERFSSQMNIPFTQNKIPEVNFFTVAPQEQYSSQMNISFPQGVASEVNFLSAHAPEKVLQWNSPLAQAVPAKSESVSFSENFFSAFAQEGVNLEMNPLMESIEDSGHFDFFSLHSSDSNGF